MILAISQSLPLALLTRACVLRPAGPVWASPRVSVTAARTTEGRAIRALSIGVIGMSA